MDITLTESAANKVKAFALEDGNPALKLRVYITGGGCAGFSYGFDLTNTLADDDIVIEHSNTGMVIDPLSYQYLVGSEIDYKEGLAGSMFVINNPNATTTCGCGSSFSV